jgi:predicted Ser/Thr protein kinase
MEETGPMVGVDCIVHDKWKIVELIAQGGFGSIFKGMFFCVPYALADCIAHNIEKKSEVVAIKTEKRANKDYLAVESEIYTKLAGMSGFPTMIWFGKTKFSQPGKPNEKLPCCILVLEYLSSSLSDLFSGNNKKFSLKSVLMLSQQMVCFI